MRKREPLWRNEQAYHAASWCQAASLSLTPRRLRGKKKAMPTQRQKRKRFLSFLSTQAIKTYLGDLKQHASHELVERPQRFPPDNTSSSSTYDT